MCLFLFIALGLWAARGRVRTTEEPCDRGLRRQRTIEWSSKQTGLSAYQNVDKRSSVWRGPDSAGSFRKVEAVRSLDAEYISIMEKTSKSWVTADAYESSRARGHPSCIGARGKQYFKARNWSLDQEKPDIRVNLLRTIILGHKGEGSFFQLAVQGEDVIRFHLC